MAAHYRAQFFELFDVFLIIPYVWFGGYNFGGGGGGHVRSYSYGLR